MAVIKSEGKRWCPACGYAQVLKRDATDPNSIGTFVHELTGKVECSTNLPERETQKSISDWAIETFGEAGSNLRVALRANNEMAELLDMLAVDDNDSRAGEEIADLFIVLARLLDKMGVNLDEEIQRKMKINRARVWTKDGSGCGQHVDVVQQDHPQDVGNCVD